MSDGVSAFDDMMHTGRFYISYDEVNRLPKNGFMELINSVATLLACCSLKLSVTNDEQGQRYVFRMMQRDTPTILSEERAS